MRHSEQVALIRRILGHMKAGTTDRGAVARSPVARYLLPERLAREQRMIRALPAMICASSQVARPGDWFTHDLSGVPIVIARGQDGVLRAFINACRHRGARVVDGVQGHCKGAMVCPFHGWVYHTDGTLRGPAMPTSFGEMDRSQFGMKPVQRETFHGVLFLRFQPGPQPSVKAILAPYDADFAAYDLENVLPANLPDWGTTLPVNWKSVRDVDNEGYHVVMAHPGLQGLYGRNYRDLSLPEGLTVSIGYFGDAPGRLWSVRHYVNRSPQAPHLPPHPQKAWSYCGIFPNAVFAFTPQAI